VAKSKDRNINEFDCRFKPDTSVCKKLHFASTFQRWKKAKNRTETGKGRPRKKRRSNNLPYVLFPLFVFTAVKRTACKEADCQKVNRRRRKKQAA
jgi:hypothetical protein